MAPATVALYLSYHPAFVAAAHNVWTTLGSNVPADVIATIQEHARRRSRGEAREVRYGTDAEGHVWASFSVTSNLRMTGVLTKRWLPMEAGSTRLTLMDEHGDPCGTAVYNAETGFTHGLGVYIRRFDVQLAQYILIVADLDWDTAYVVHGDQKLLEGPSPRADSTHLDGPSTTRFR